MAKSIFENAMLVDVTTITDGQYTNSHIHICELGRKRPQIVSIKVKNEDAEKFKQFQGKVVPSVTAQSFDKSGIAKNGKPYAFTEYSYDSLVPPAKAA